MKKLNIIFSAVILAISFVIIIFLATGSWKIFYNSNDQEHIKARIITPQETNSSNEMTPVEPSVWEENNNIKIAIDEGEEILAVLVLESEGEYSQEQIAAYRHLAEIEGPVYITCISYDDKNNEYRRIWSDISAATRSETISLYTHDLIGDRSSCVIITGMNNQNEHTMTIFKRNHTVNQSFSKIAEFAIDGSIIIQEKARSLAYQQGITTGASYTIAAYSHDVKSQNMLDQIETTYSYNPASGKYEVSSVTRIPGSQIEQRRLRELLSGVPGVFENFISDLWYYVSPQGTIDSKQYLYFNPSGREIIFFGDENQQVFYWHNSTPTRYGLYITAQNISISTLRRFIDIELESLDSVHLRVFEDVKLKITVSASWDGSYRRAARLNETNTPFPNVIDAQYDSPWGRVQFMSNGEYLINASGVFKKGRYSFFKANEQRLLELRPEYESADKRLVYRVETGSNNSLYITRVKIGPNRIQDLLEGQIVFSQVEGVGSRE